MKMAVNPLPAIAAGTRILVDSNIFIYAFTGRSLQCQQILERSQKGVTRAVTTIEVVNEVCHRLMLPEALERGVIDKISALSLRSKATEITTLTSYWKRIEEIFDLNITVLALDEGRVRRAHRLRSAHGLLTNDSLIAAAAQEQSSGSLATSDRDFERIGWLTTYRATDLSQRWSALTRVSSRATQRSAAQRHPHSKPDLCLLHGLLHPKPIDTVCYNILRSVGWLHYPSSFHHRGARTELTSDPTGNPDAIEKLPPDRITAVTNKSKNIPEKSQAAVSPPLQAAESKSESQQKCV